jgi:hypothetical protein
MIGLSAEEWLKELEAAIKARPAISTCCPISAGRRCRQPDANAS